MRKFSIGVHHTTIYRWNKQYGKDRYLYRAIDSNGETLDMWLRNHRDTVSTKAFMKRLLRDYGQPRSIVTDKYAPSLKAIKELKEDGILVKNVTHWKSKYLNNILEQDWIGYTELDRKNKVCTL